MLDLSQEAPDYKHYTPLHFALEEKNQDIVEMLVGNPERCADINVPPISGYADILEFACQESDEDCTKSLLLHPEAKSSKFLLSAWKRAVQ
ncbi:hypothetical protein FVEN_g9535 [Fusarium venenatum]|uniref:Uncharacterized protein n=1 Tax=Fusarium venenatum TaxID=56646 RepID=A0A2L2U166_9HYPO|nr:uncharacterized protein FVRRES_04237 [Fusarium venenatum]KAG8352396.1 hypothetical protein FVEN_g9535 [Fusarium venenatum]CEI67725.1 unnamed protein product [Fusarium venenatum]